MQKDPDLRIPSASALLERLQPLIARHGSDSPSNEVAPPVVWHRVLTLAASALLLVLLGVGVAFALREFKENQRAQEAHSNSITKELTAADTYLDNGLLSEADEVLARLAHEEIPQKLEERWNDSRRRYRELAANAAETARQRAASDALTARLRELEERKADFEDVSRRAPAAKMVIGAESKWREIVGNLENLRHYATPDEITSAREAIREIVGEITVVEKGTHVFAQTMLNENMGLNSGAEKRT